jgi:hypothetical protein
VGPRVFACGPIHDGEPPIWPGSVVVTDVEFARGAVKRVADEGYKGTAQAQPDT